MKFEYKLDYDFVTNELTFEITKMPENLRRASEITTVISKKGNKWDIVSYYHPEISCLFTKIYLRGGDSHRDKERVVVDKTCDEAVEIAEVLKKFQAWVEDQDKEVLMTVAEIEAKLGIKNLKIVKENK